MNLDIWAKRWNIPHGALHDLRRIFGCVPEIIAHNDAHSEAGIQSRIRLEASRKGARLWRNNVGATYTKDGTFLRYGLGNDSKQANSVIKSADLIGIRPVIITTHHVGFTIGQFVSREVKRADWKYRDTDRERAQLQWAELIVSLGGDACFVNREGTL